MALVKNSLLGLVPTIAGVVVSLATVPLYLSMVGTERYGALLVAMVLLGYFGQADFGLGRAITQRLSSMRDGQPDERASIVWSALAGAAVISLIGGAIVYVAAGLFFGSFFDASAALRAEVVQSAWLFALCVPVIMLTGVASGALTGLERFGVVSIGTTIGNLLSQILPLVVASAYTVEFSWLLAASIIGRVIGLIPISYSMGMAFLVGQPVEPSSEQLRRLFAYGSWIMLTAIVGPLMVSADRVLIGAVLGGAAVVAYSVPTQIAMRTALFPVAVSQALFPRLAAGEAAESSALGSTSAVVVGQLYAFVVVGLMCLGGPLLQLWLGPALDPRSLMVGQITLIGFWLNALANVPYALIQAKGNSRFTAVLHVAELPVYVLMLWALGSSFGLYGVAMAFTLRNLIDCIALFQKAKFLDSVTLFGVAGPAAVIIVTCAAAQWVDGWASALAMASLSSGILMVLTWSNMPPEIRGWLVTRRQR